MHKVSADRMAVARFYEAADWALLGGAALAGFLLLLVPGGMTELHVAVVTLSVCGVLAFIRCILLHDDVSASLVMASTLGLGYGIGTLNSLLNGYADYMSLLQLTYATAAQITESIALILLLYALLYFIHKTVPVRQLPHPGEDRPEDAIVVMLAAAAFACVVVVFVAIGKIGMQLDVSAEEGSSTISASSAIVISALAPMSATAVFFAMKRAGLVRLMLLGSALTMLLVQATQGRRVFMYSAICCLIAYAHATRSRSLLTWRHAVLVVVLAMSALTASKVFYSMRQATSEMGKNKNIPALLERGIKDLLNRERSDFDEKFKENQDTRTFIIGYLAEINEAVKTHPTQEGAVFVLGVVSAIPTAIWPGKWAIMAVGSEEALAHPALGLPIWDASNTILTAGLSDFGVWGFFAYAILVALMFTLGAHLVRRLYLPAQLAFGFGSLYILLSVETAFAGYVSSLRELVILTLMLQALTWCLRALFASRRPYLAHAQRERARLKGYLAAQTLDVLP